MEERVYRQMALIEESHWWFVGRQRIVSGLLGNLHLPKRARILEVGCGTGGNTEMLQSFGEVVSIEPNETARALAAAKGRSKVLDGALPNRLPDDLGQFDLVVALDVLEHIDEDRESLQGVEGPPQARRIWSVFGPGLPVSLERPRPGSSPQAPLYETGFC